MTIGLAALRDSTDGSVWRTLTIATGWLLLLFVGAYLITPASILTLVMADLAVSESTAAALVSMPQVAATVIGIPVGIYLDRVETRAAVPVAAVVLLVGSVGDWVAASRGTVSLLVASRLFAGVGMMTGGPMAGGPMGVDDTGMWSYQWEDISWDDPEDLKKALEVVRSRFEKED